MNFAIGYQQPENGQPFPEIVADYRERIEEVYFPWVGAASGRAALGTGGGGGGRDWQAQAILERDLAELRRQGIKLDLLFNANCYGAAALSEALGNEIGSIIDHIGGVCGLPDVVTTTSLTIAHVVKTHFPGIETRASVNMRIGTIQAMDYAGAWFDSYYLQRDLQRDPDYVGKMHDWCLAHDKKLCLLVNSGCLRFCPGQIYHDNLVAHDAEIDKRRNIPGFNPHVCWNLYRDPDRLVEFLKATWIRPEDLSRYEGLADLFKLATRQHTHPRMVIEAYVSGHYRGDLLNLMEPCFAPAMAPRYLENSAFPDDWAKRMARCDDDCDTCGYCNDVLKMVVKTYENIKRE